MIQQNKVWLFRCGGNGFRRRERISAPFFVDKLRGLDLSCEFVRLLYPPDQTTERAQFLFNFFVSPVEVVNPVDQGFPLGYQAGQDK